MCEKSSKNSRNQRNFQCSETLKLQTCPNDQFTFTIIFVRHFIDVKRQILKTRFHRLG